MDKAASSAAISSEGLARVLLSAGLALAVFHLPFLIGNGLPYYLLSAAAFTVPLAGYSLYRISLYKGKRIRDYDDSSMLYRFLCSRRFAYLASIIAAVAISLALPVAVYLFSPAEYIAFMSAALAAALMSALCRAMAVGRLRIYREAAADYHLARADAWILAFCTVIVYPFIAYFLRDAVLSLPFCPGDIGRLGYSGAVTVIATVLDSFLRMSGMVLGSRTASIMADDAFLALFVVICQGGILILALSRAAIFFSLGRDRLKVITEPLAGSSRAISLRSIVLAAIISMAVMAGIASVAVDSEVADAVGRASVEMVETVEVAVDEIDGILYRKGTMLLIGEVGESFAAKTKAELEAIVDDYFDDMAAGVDVYLDWYYSIGGQYSQLWNMVKGMLTDGVEEAVGSLMEEKMSELINPGCDINADISAVIAANDGLFRDAVGLILDENRIVEKDSEEYVVTATASLEDLVTGNLPDTLFTPSLHAAFGIGTGAASGIIIGRIAKRSIQSAAGRLAVKAASKPIVSKLGGAKIGTALGSLAGPLGSLVGFAGGVVAGEVVSWATIKLDESLNRGDYRDSILDDIEAMRQETLLQIASL